VTLSTLDSIGMRISMYMNISIYRSKDVKTERVTFLATKEFKLFLGEAARREGVSVAELVRVRCEQNPSADEVTLAELTGELREALTEAKSSLRAGIEEARSVLTELKSKRLGREQLSTTVGARR
jgi:hypothetical protein